jgi:hypothetical protein
MARHKKISRLYGKLLDSEKVLFPATGYKFSAPSQKGVYIIYNYNDKVVHVGCTPRARYGIRQRLCNHLQGKSSFVGQFLRGNGTLLRLGYGFRCLVVEEPCDRKYLEGLAIGKLCPKHIGKG